MSVTKLVVSPSKIETFRLFIHEEYNGTITQEKVIESIKGEKQYTREATFGNAFHKVIEDGIDGFEIQQEDQGIFYAIPVEGPEGMETMWLHQSEIVQALRYRSMYPKNVYEVKLNFKLRVGRYEVVIAMRMDSINGLNIHEQKTVNSESGLYDKYDSSLQWRMYAMAMGSNFVQYNIFPVKQPTEKTSKRQFHEVGYYFFRLYPYPTMRKDVESWIARYIEFAERQDLLPFLLSKY